jgi:hypothetical protein
MRPRCRSLAAVHVYQKVSAAHAQSPTYAIIPPQQEESPIPRKCLFLPACIHSSSSLDFLSLFPSQLIRPQYQTNCSPFCTQTYLAYSSNHVNSPLFSTSSAGSREGVVGAIVLMERLRLNRWFAASIVRDSLLVVQPS